MLHYLRQSWEAILRLRFRYLLPEPSGCWPICWSPALPATQLCCNASAWYSGHLRTYWVPMLGPRTMVRESAWLQLSIGKVVKEYEWNIYIYIYVMPASSCIIMHCLPSNWGADWNSEALLPYCSVQAWKDWKVWHGPWPQVLPVVK